MRGGGTISTTSSAVHQTLTSEAASVLKQSQGVARRRGHAQVTPLHVAFTLLSTSRASHLLRRACLKSQPPILSSHHPLQCRALELCFNVALNRLPTLTTSPLLHHQQPSLSNALVAALKRAQAHQRRGSIEQQQQQQQQQQNHQPLLAAAKVELEQLVVSILDDPSVSRVMREAGFSSPSVKSHLEDSLLTTMSSSSSSMFPYHHHSTTRGGGGVYSSPASPKDQLNNNCFWPTQYFFNHSSSFSSTTSDHQSIIPLPPPLAAATIPLINNNNCVKLSLDEDVKLVLEVMMSKKRSNTVIIGDSTTHVETLVWELRDRVERGDHSLPWELRRARFIRLRFEAEALRVMKTEDVEQNYLKDLRNQLQQMNNSSSSSSACSSCIIYVGDLKWAAIDHHTGASAAAAADYLVKEIARLVVMDHNYNINGGGSCSYRVWLLATASLHTYIKCRQTRPHHPPLDVQWRLQTVSVPASAAALALTLHASTSSLNEEITTPLLKSASTKKELLEQDKLKCCGEKEAEEGLCKSSSHYNEVLPSWLQPQCTTQVDSGHQYVQTMDSPPKPKPKPKPKQWWVPDENKMSLLSFRHENKSSSSISFALPVVSNSVPRFRRQNEYKSPNLSSLRNTHEDKITTDLALGNNIEMASWQRGNMYSRVLKEYIPWQSENIPGIVQVMCNDNDIGDIWFLVQGNDQIGKMRMASGIADSVSSSLVHLKMGAAAATAVDLHHGGVELLLTRALQPAGINNNDHRVVVLVEDFDLGDSRFVKLLTDRFHDENVSAKPNRVIFVLTMSSGNVVKLPTTTTIPMVLKVYKNGSPNLDKRKAAAEEEEDDDHYYFLMSKIQKKPRIATIDHRGLMESASKKVDLSRQSSFNDSLDLNIRADEVEEDESPVSSDLTREMNTCGSGMNEISPCDHLVRSIKNNFIFNRSPARDREMKEVIGSKIKASFDEVYGGGSGGGGGAHNNNNKKKVNLGIEDRVLEMVLLGGGDSFVNKVFERWVKEIFKTSLERGKQMINMGENGISFKLCINGGGDNLQGQGQGEGEGEERGGFLGTNLPNNILLVREEEKHM